MVAEGESHGVNMEQRAEGMGKCSWQLAAGRQNISKLSFGLPPFRRVPGFGLRIANFEIRKISDL
jgi:hypothetical protein